VKKALLIGLIVCVLAVGGIGAAFAAGISSWNNVGMLARGGTTVSGIGVDKMGYVISSGKYDPAQLCGVILSFDALVPANSVIFISVRDDGTPSDELAYYAADNNAAIPKGADTTFWLYNMSNVQYTPGTHLGGLPDVSQVTTIVVTVAGNSTYNTP